MVTQTSTKGEIMGTTATTAKERDDLQRVGHIRLAAKRRWERSSREFVGESDPPMNISRDSISHEDIATEAHEST